MGWHESELPRRGMLGLYIKAQLEKITTMELWEDTAPLDLS